MTPRHYNELMRQAEVIEKDKLDKEFHKLWEEFRIQNPNTVGGYSEQFMAFQWLWSKLKEYEK